MFVLLERTNVNNHSIDVWYSEADDSSEESIKKELQDLPKSTSMGSFALISTEDGLFVFTKGKKGNWNPA